MKPQFKYLKPFLILLNVLPKTLYNIKDEKVIDTDEIIMDEKIISSLRKV